jgi:hypothetical protein
MKEKFIQVMMPLKEAEIEIEDSKTNTKEDTETFKIFY